jgi:hypothetical protein
MTAVMAVATLAAPLGLAVHLLVAPAVTVSAILVATISECRPGERAEHRCRDGDKCDFPETLHCDTPHRLLKR